MENAHPTPEQNGEYAEYKVTQGDDREYTHRSDPAIDLSALGAEINAELGGSPEADSAEMEEKKAEFKVRLFKLIGEAAIAEVDDILRGDVPSGEQMVSRVLNRAIHSGDVARGKAPQRVQAIKENPPLRAEVQTYLAKQFEGRLKNAGQDEVLISKIEKALSALGA